MVYVFSFSFFPLSSPFSFLFWTFYETGVTLITLTWIFFKSPLSSFIFNMLMILKKNFFFLLAILFFFRFRFVTVTNPLFIQFLVFILVSWGCLDIFITFFFLKWTWEFGSSPVSSWPLCLVLVLVVSDFNFLLFLDSLASSSSLS